MNLSRFLAILIALALSAPAFAGDFGSEAKRLRIALDSGVDAQVATREFIQSIIENGVTAGDFETYMRTRMTAREFAALKADLAIVSTGSPAEYAGFFSRALPLVGSSGLAWTADCPYDLPIGLALLGGGIAAIYFGSRSDGATFQALGVGAGIDGLLAGLLITGRALGGDGFDCIF